MKASIDRMDAFIGTDRGTVGGTFISFYQDKQWPVVICDETTSPAAFMASRLGLHVLPAILLGRRKYVWVDRRSLEEFDLNRDYLNGLPALQENDVRDNDSFETTLEKQRRIGFRQDAQFMADHKFWQNYILNQSQARKEDTYRRKKLSCYGESNSTTCIGLSHSSTPREIRKGQTGQRRYAPPVDGCGGIYQLSSRSRVSKRTKQKHNGPLIVEVATGPFAPRPPTAANTPRHQIPRFPAEDQSPMAKKASRRISAKTIVIDLQTEDEEDEIVVNDSSCTIALSGSGEARHEPLPIATLTQDPTRQLAKLVFSQDDTGANMLIPQSSLAKCKYLNMRCNYSSQHGCNIIPLGTDSQAIRRKLTSKEIQHILPYFWSNELGPVFRSKDKRDPHPFGRLDSQLKENHAKTLGMAFITASKISHEALQEHILEKLQALHPLTELSLLSMVVMYSSLPPPKTAAELNMGSWIVEHVVDSYPRLMEFHSTSLIRLFNDNTDLKAAVMGILGVTQRGKRKAAV